MFQKLGAKVIGLDPMEYRCKLAEDMGIKITSSCTNQEEIIKKLKLF